MPVLAVTRVDCLKNARDCTPSPSPRNIAMVGIGFGREGDRQSQSTPDKNPLLRVAAGDGQRRQGYVLTHDGVRVGLTGANTRGDFRFVKLERLADGRDWAGIPACISLNGRSPPACGNMLMDTGVSAMFMTVPPEQAGGMNRTLPDGTSVPSASVRPERVRTVSLYSRRPITAGAARHSSTPVADPRLRQYQLPPVEWFRCALRRRRRLCGVSTASLDHEDFGSNRSKILNRIDSNSCEHNVVRSRIGSRKRAKHLGVLHRAAKLISQKRDEEPGCDR